MGAVPVVVVGVIVVVTDDGGDVGVVVAGAVFAVLVVGGGPVVDFVGVVVTGAEGAAGGIDAALEGLVRTSRYSAPSPMNVTHNSTVERRTPIFGLTFSWSACRSAVSVTARPPRPSPVARQSRRHAMHVRNGGVTPG